MPSGPRSIARYLTLVSSAGLGDAHDIVMRDDFLGAVIGQRQHRAAGLHHRARALGDGDEAVDRDVHRHQEIVDGRVDELSAQLVLVRKADRVDDEVEPLPLRLSSAKAVSSASMSDTSQSISMSEPSSCASGRTRFSSASPW